MKEAVNMIAGFRERKRIGSTAAEIDQPPRELAEMIYGLRAVAEPFGMWILLPSDLSFLLDETITVQHWSGPTNEVTNGTLFSIHGLRFAVSLADEEPPWRLLGNMTGWREYESVRHLRNMRYDSIGVSLAFRWPTSLATVSVLRGRTVGSSAT